MASAAGAGNAAAVIAADIELHRGIVAGAGHPVLLDMWEGLNGQMGALMRSSLDRQGVGLDESVRRHVRLLSVVRDAPASGVAAELRAHYLDPDSLR